MILLLENRLYSLYHTLVSNIIEESLYHVGKSRDCVEVAMLTPNPVGCEYAFCHLAGVAGSPKLCEEVHNLLVVIRLDRSTVSTSATLVVSDDGSKTENETLWKFALTFKIYLYSREVTRLELRE